MLWNANRAQKNTHIKEYKEKKTYKTQQEQLSYKQKTILSTIRFRRALVPALILHLSILLLLSISFSQMRLGLLEMLSKLSNVTTTLPK